MLKRGREFMEIKKTGQVWGEKYLNGINTEKAIKCIPNIMTLLNIALGTNAIFIMVTGESKARLIIATLSIILAGILDRYDGKLARYLDAECEMGKQLDSLADLVSFGVAPMVIIWNMGLSQTGIIGHMAATLFVLAGAFRLARFNVSCEKGVCTGLPITIAGGTLALSVFIHCIFNEGNLTYEHLLLLGAVALFLAVLMVGNFRIKKI